MVRNRVGLLVIMLCSLVLLLAIGANVGAAAEEFNCSISTISPTNVTPGGTVDVGYTWQGNAEEVYQIVVAITDSGGSELVKGSAYLRSAEDSDSIRLMIPVTASSGEYDVLIESASTEEELDRRPGAVTVIIPEASLAIVSPTSGSPAQVVAGQSVSVAIRYSSYTELSAVIRIGNGISQKVDLTASPSARTVTTPIPIPAGMDSGSYDVNLSVDGDPEPIDSEVGAVRVVDVIANIEDPVGGDPVVAVPGEYLAVTFNYVAGLEKSLTVKLIAPDGATVRTATATVGATAATKSKTVHILLPDSLVSGHYGLELADGSTTLDSEDDAVIYEGVTVQLTEPTNDKPRPARPRDTVTIKFEYRAKAKTTVDFVIEDDEGDDLVSKSLSLDKTSSEKTGTVSLVLPSSTANGKYTVLARVRASGVVLDSELDAVLVDNVTINITRPVHNSPFGAVPGGDLDVRFNYTSANRTYVTVRLTGPGSRVYGTTSCSLLKTSTSITEDAVVRVSTRIPPGSYDIEVVSRSTGAVLDREEDAVVVEDLNVEILSPTEDSAPSLKPGSNLNVRFRYESAENATVVLEAVDADGHVAATKECTLAPSITKRELTVQALVTFGSPPGEYDIRARSKQTGAVLAVEKDALVVLPSDIIRFVIGKSGRWVNGAYQATDCPPAIIQGRTMLPIRHVGEPLGLVFTWDAGEKLVTVRSGVAVIKLWIGKNRAQVSKDGGATWAWKTVDATNSKVYPTVLSGRTMVPVRFITETLGGRIDWDATTRTVTVRS